MKKTAVLLISFAAAYIGCKQEDPMGKFYVEQRGLDLQLLASWKSPSIQEDRPIYAWDKAGVRLLFERDSDVCILNVKDRELKEEIVKKKNVGDVVGGGFATLGDSIVLIEVVSESFLPLSQAPRTFVRAIRLTDGKAERARIAGIPGFGLVTGRKGNLSLWNPEAVRHCLQGWNFDTGWGDSYCALLFSPTLCVSGDGSIYCGYVGGKVGNVFGEFPDGIYHSSLDVGQRVLPVERVWVDSINRRFYLFESNNGLIHADVWSLESGKFVRRLALGAGAAVELVAGVGDSRFAISFSDGSVALFEVSEGWEFLRGDTDKRFEHFIFSPTDDILVGITGDEVLLYQW